MAKNLGRVTKQHVVSRVVLSEFAVDRHLEVEDARHPGRWRRKAPAGVGYVNDFVQHDSVILEALWQTVETRLPEAIRLIRDGVPPQPGSVEESTVRDCIALHWARSKAVKTTSTNAWHTVQARHMQDFRTQGRDLLAAVHMRRTGRPGTEQELNALNAELHAEPAEIQDGRHFASRVPPFFQFARDRFAKSHVQVLRCGDGVEDLLMSDCPVLTPANDGAGLNPQQGVALGDAAAAGMPLGPRVFVSLHGAAELVVLDAAQVALLNSLQARVRHRQMFRRPRPVQLSRR